MKEPTTILQKSANVLPVSVIIPLYRAPFFEFRLCLNSIASQTKKPKYVIIIDDGNENVLYEKLVNQFKEMVQDEIIVKFIQLSDNYGVSYARNVGLSRVKTEWVAFVDADDCIKENYFERLFQEVNDEVDIIACACDAYDGSTYRRNHFFKGDRTFRGKEGLVRFEKALIDDAYHREDTFIDTAIGVPWGKLYRFSCVPVGFDESLKRMEDNIWNHKIIASNPELVIRYIDEPLYIYRTKHINEYNVEYEEDVSTWFNVIEYRKQILEHHLIANDDVANLFYDEVTKLLAFTLKKNYFHRDKPKTQRKVGFEELKKHLNDETIKEALKRDCEGKPIYRSVMNRLLMKGYIELAFLVNRIRGR